MSYQQCTRFRTTLDFDREYLWNGSCNRQADNGVIKYYFFHVRWKFSELWSIYDKNDLNFWPMTFKLNRVLAVVKGHVHATYYQAKRSASWVIVRILSFFALSRKGEKSENPVLWPWPLTLKFSAFRAVHELSWAQKKKKSSDEHNTVRRYRADSNKLNCWRSPLFWIFCWQKCNIKVKMYSGRHF